ncbi:MAG TPA: ketopantoate reductase C-terminal domain-containing protein, partial [Clostridia bacterium]|nr:ketopantoate reductase C-terminal domain-containing protein [Clostridia bacterium]
RLYSDLSKSLAYHRIDFVWSHFRLGIQENVVIGGKSANLGDLSPLAFWHNRYGDGYTNSFTTLVGMGYREVTSLRAYKEVLSNSMYEGLKILKKMGIKEFKTHTMPGWIVIKMGAKLPDFITDGIFKKNLAKMVLSSMAQDVIQRKTGANELESLIGAFISLADKYNVDIPYNRTVYELCKKKFAEEVFVPMTEEEVLAEVRKKQAK